MYFQRFLPVCAIITLLLCGCRSGKTGHLGQQGDTLRFKYASLLTVVKYHDYTVATIRNPWKMGETLHSYVLVSKEKKIDHLPAGTVVRVPLARSIVFSTAHCQLLEYLQAQDAIKGVCDLKYILIQDIQQRAKSGKIVDCGNGMSPMIEKIIDLRPDALLVSPFENSGGYGKLEVLDVPIIEAADYMENSPLGRAEWMRFYGLLYGKEHQADSLFHAVEQHYHQLKVMASRLSLGRSVLTERKTGSVWYCPGGKSTIGQMIADAHAQYAFSNDTHSGSLALSFESVLDKAGNTDVWIFKYNGDRPMSKADLLAEFPGYDGLKAFREGNIYECNCSRVPYFEEVPFRPDWLLQELIALLHPSVRLPLRYYKERPAPSSIH
ncbi:MAG: ABC transporter substrate-binding protein [Prevotella sp.]|jgi:iron complex transport system substrate-binding protein|nr:ABC transporter substrate-binding protein [Prevotella sp.]MCI2081441.1 ABC transporter substrate-binding protein [Prevotella sp.]MCI2103321.1 ABC transporter substrate-binding protein [Prevotella sp.]HCN52411.1 ABC transporter substrate-binding protein [Prevotella sp.]